MIYLIFLVVCFGASIVGAICGIGGGVIIKPVLDSFGVLDVTAISFLSGCTVLSMTTYSVLKNKISGESHVSMKTGLPLAIGAAVGGLIGKWLFSYVKSLSSDPNKVGAVQALCLLIVTLGTLIYTIYKAKIKTYKVGNAIVCVLIGVFLFLYVNKNCSRKFSVHYFLLADCKSDFNDRFRKRTGFSDRSIDPYGRRWYRRRNLWTCDQ